MGLPAARIGDLHTCPEHAGGPIVTGQANVLIGGSPAARVSDTLLCDGVPADVIVQGEPTVLIGGKPASRLSDKTAHGGVVVTGCGSVLIGSQMGQCLRVAALSAAVFVPEMDS